MGGSLYLWKKVGCRACPCTGGRVRGVEGVPKKASWWGLLKGILLSRGDVGGGRGFLVV